MTEFSEVRNLSNRLRHRYRDHDLSGETHEKYNPWLGSMQLRSSGILVPVNRDEKLHPEQSIFEPIVEARDPNPDAPDDIIYEGVKSRLVLALGEQSYDELLNQLIEQPATRDDDPGTLLGRLALNRQLGKNTMVVTSHMSFMELAYFNNLRYMAKQDRPNIDKNAVVLSKLLSRVSYMGQPVSEAARPTANVLFSSPLTESTENYEIPEAATKVINALFIKSLRSYLGRGGLELDVALTGRQIIAHPEGATGNSVNHFEIPEIAPTSAELIRCFDDIVPVTLMWSSVTSKWEMAIDDIIDVQQALQMNIPIEIVQAIYGKMAGHIEAFTKKEVDYPGSPRRTGRRAIDQGFE